MLLFQSDQEQQLIEMLPGFLEKSIIALAIGIAAGVLASWCFLHFYLKVKVPKIKISPQISRTMFKGEMNHFFKFVNDTKCEIFDVRVELTLYKPVGNIGGSDLQGTDLKLKDNFFSYMTNKKKSGDNFNSHAMRVRTTHDIRTEWQDPSSFVRLTVIARHSLSGLSRVFVQNYPTKDLIIDGKFKSGDDLTVNRTG